MELIEKQKNSDFVVNDLVISYFNPEIHLLHPCFVSIPNKLKTNKGTVKYNTTTINYETLRKIDMDLVVLFNSSDEDIYMPSSLLFQEFLDESRRNGWISPKYFYFLDKESDIDYINDSDLEDFLTRTKMSRTEFNIIDQDVFPFYDFKTLILKPTFIDLHNFEFNKTIDEYPLYQAKWICFQYENNAEYDRVLYFPIDNEIEQEESLSEDLYNEGDSKSGNSSFMDGKAKYFVQDSFEIDNFTRSTNDVVPVILYDSTKVTKLDGHLGKANINVDSNKVNSSILNPGKELYAFEEIDFGELKTVKIDQVILFK